jgi:hypothetical protein
MMTFTLGITSENEITILPDQNYTKENKLNISTHRAKSGKLYTYRWSSFKKIKFSASLFDTSDASIVNSWWDTQTKLIFFEYDGTTTFCTSVQIMNKEAPFMGFEEPKLSLRSGTIELEEYM